MSITPIFKLKEPEKDGLTSIRFYFYLNNRRFVYSLGSSNKIHPQLWDQRRMRTISTKTKYVKDVKELNANKYLLAKWKDINPHIKTDLRNLDTRIENIVTLSRKFISLKEEQSENIDFKELKEYLNESFEIVKKTPQTPKELTLNEFIEQYIQDIESGEETFINHNDDVRKYSKGTAKVYKEWKTQFEDFQKKKKRKYDFDDITMDFYKVYVRYFSNKGYTTNSIGKQVKVLKAIMNKAHQKGLHKNAQYKLKSFKTLHNTTTEVYLTNDELQRLYNIDLSAKPHQDLARDVFLVGCYTALRYSDYSRIRPIHLKIVEGVKYLEIITKKTGTKVTMPIRPELDQILTKYEYSLPKTYEQKVNKYIKEVAKLDKVAINEMVQIEKTIKGMKVSKEVPKSDMIKTHTARRTGCSLMYLAGIPTLDICKISGHSSEKNLLKYIRVSKEETAKRLSMNSFFSGKISNINGN